MPINAWRITCLITVLLNSASCPSRLKTPLLRYRLIVRTGKEEGDKDEPLVPLLATSGTQITALSNHGPGHDLRRAPVENRCPTVNCARTAEALSNKQRSCTFLYDWLSAPGESTRLRDRPRPRTSAVVTLSSVFSAGRSLNRVRVPPPQRVCTCA